MVETKDIDYEAQFNLVTTYVNVPKEVAEAEITSFSNETLGLPDKYTFHRDEKGFFAVVEKYKRYVDDLMERTSYLGEIEGKIYDKLLNWYDNNNNGEIIWFSPPHSSDEEYKDRWKIINHRISFTESGEKVLRNTSILFITKDEMAISIIHKFFPKLSNINDTEEIRRMLIELPDSIKIGDIYKEIIKIDPEFLARGERITKKEQKAAIKHITNMIHLRVNPYFIVSKMNEYEVVGERGSSCPGKDKDTFSNILEELSSGMDEFGSLLFTCEICGEINIRTPGQLLTKCQHCGESVVCG